MSSDKKSQSSLAHVKSKIKVVFLGDQSTGKTSILLRYMQDKFEEGQAPTVGIDFMAKNITVGSTNLRLQLWDTAGQQRFRSLIPSYLKDATVTFIVFDITNRRSFENVRQWIQLCNQNRKQKCIMILVGTKSDLSSQRQVTQQQINKFAKNEDICYFEVSSKKNLNIKQMFRYAAQEYVSQQFANQVTVGNIQNLHNNYLSKQQKKPEKPPICLKQKPIVNENQKKKGSSCC